MATRPDPALQRTFGPMVNATTGTHFDGIGANGSAPPDTNIAVGPNHVVEMVNSRYQIFTKGGTTVLGPNSLSSLWTPLGGTCSTANAGDPVIQYDRLADRWVFTQLGSLSSPYSQCIAVSKTSDPTGAYNLYSYAYSTTLNDYPKFGVWPTATNSSYTATYNLFAGGASFSGGQLCAYDRAGMLAGAASPAAVCYTITNDGGFLPSDLDGATPPLDGTPAYFMTWETTTTLRMYSIAPNFANPSSSTLTQLPDLTVASFTQPCSSNCVPQLGTTQKLDVLSDRMMYRLAYRMFADHASFAVNHSVTAGTSIGVRWYEIRSPLSISGPFSIFQQGTFAPDATYRWMGSAAMDKTGDYAIGFSASSSSINPGIRYTGRVPTDPLGTLQSEATIQFGTGSQTASLSRWGDYSALRIDPSDDCTFWFTTEYLKASGTFNWSTHIGSFVFPTCGGPPAPDFTIAAVPSSLTFAPGGGGTSTVTVTALNGYASAVNLTVSGCPTNATCLLSPSSVNPTATSTLTVTSTAAIAGGTYTLTITGSDGTLSHSTTVGLTVQAPSPDFAMNLTPASLTIARQSTGTTTVGVSQINGASSVTLAASGLPVGASASFTPKSLTTPGTSSMKISVTRRATPGTYTVVVVGTNGTFVHKKALTLTVQ